MDRILNLLVYTVRPKLYNDLKLFKMDGASWEHCSPLQNIRESETVSRLKKVLLMESVGKKSQWKRLASKEIWEH